MSPGVQPAARAPGAGQSLPLTDVKVVEYGEFISAAYCARLLADAGAEVIKVEPLEGDEARRRGPFPQDISHAERSGLFTYLNTSKRGMTLDMRHPRGKQVFLDLLQSADILVENNSPAAMESMELDFPTLHAHFPRLIVTSLTPFGQTGPYREFKGDDLIALNMGGLAYATPGFPDRIEEPLREPPLRPATYMSDFLAGLSGAAATFMALFSRMADGSGRHVDVSQQETIASMMLWDLAHQSYLGISKRRYPTEGPGAQPNTYLPCKDGYVVIVAFTDDHWRRLVEAMGSPEWATNKLFEESASRVQYWDALEPMLCEWTKAHKGEEIVELAQARGIPCFRGYELVETLESEHLAARGYLVEVKSGDVRWKMPGLPFRFSNMAARPLAPAPSVGQHTNEILSNVLSYDPGFILSLQAEGAV